MNNITALDKTIRQIIAACHSAVCHWYPDARIILYGSRARGEAGPDSDIDLLVLLQQRATSRDVRNIRDTLYDIGLTNDLVISVIVRDVEQWNSPILKATPLYKSIRKEGIEV